MARKRLFVGLCVGAALVAMAATASAESLSPVDDPVNLRSGPGLNYPIMGLLRSGEKLPVLGSDQSWFRVRTADGREAWAAAWVTRVSYQDALVFAQVDTDVLNVRGGPGTNYPVLRTVRQGERYRLLETSGDWWLVQVSGNPGGEGQVGWISRFYARQEAPPALRPVATARRAVVPAADMVSVRRGRSQRYDVLDTVKAGENLGLLDLAEGWAKVQSPRGQIGWVPGSQVVLFDQMPFDAAPVYRLDEGRWAIHYLPQRRVTEPAGLNLRTGANLNARILSVLKVNTSFKVLSEQAGWLQVLTTAGEWGWVAQEFTGPGAPRPGRLERVEVQETSPGVVQLTLAGDLAGASPVTWPEQNALAVLLPAADRPETSLPLADHNLQRLNVTRDGVFLEFQRMPLWQVREHSAQRLVLETRNAVQTVDLVTQPDRQVLRFALAGDVRATAWAEGGASVMELRGTDWPAQGLLPAGLQILAQDQGRVKLRFASTRSFALQTGPGQLDWIFYVAGLSGKTIVIDPGHGGPDPGAVAKEGVPGLRESDVNLAVSLELKKALEAKGARVILTRNGDNGAAAADKLQGLSPYDQERLELNSRTEVANQARADLFLSVHGNGGGKGERGTEVYWSGGNLNSAASQRLAGMLQRELVQALGRPDRGAKEQIFYVVTFAQAPAALVELAFLSDPAEAKLLADPAFWARAAQALVRAAEQFFSAAPAGTPAGAQGVAPAQRPGGK